MIVGLLPSLGGGIRELASTGQAPRLVDGYLRPYVRAFGRVLYFSYLRESLQEFTDDRALLDGVEMLTPGHPVSRARRAVTMPWAHAASFRACAVLRVFRVTGVVPAILAGGGFGVACVPHLGLWFGRCSRSGPERVAHQH